MTVLLLFLMVSLSDLVVNGQMYDLQCDVKGVAPSEHILPMEQEVNTKSFINLTEYLKIGNLKCLEHLHGSSSSPTSTQRDFLNRYGIFFLHFGPISHCSTFSKCWFGMLSCGEMKNESFLEEYNRILNQPRSKGGMQPSLDLPFRDMPEFLGWSMQSLEIQFRVAGPEVLFPEVVYFPAKNILLCFYTLTIPGSYRIDIAPREFYPGKLFKYTNVEKIEGYDLLGYHSLVRGPRPVVLSLPMTSTPLFCDQTNMQQSLTTITLPRNLPTPLPYCSKGNHPGRFLTIPTDSLRICGVSNFAGQDRHYIASNQDNNERQLRSILIQKYLDQSQPIEHRLLSQELLKHTDRDSSLCPLIVMNEIAEARDTRHEIFAPYKCRYKYYSPLQVHFIFSFSFASLFLQAKSCLKILHRTNSYSIGDSLTRDLYASINIFMNLSRLSLSQMKTLITDKFHVRCYQSSITFFTSFIVQRF
jgi:hypothetical protein